MNEHPVLVIIDTIENRPSSPPAELIAAARSAAGGATAPTVLVAGCAVESLAHDLAAQHGCPVIALQDDRLLLPNPGLLAALSLTLTAELTPSLVMLAHTVRNCHTAAALAVALGASCVTAVEGIAASPAGWTCRRAVFNGKLIQHVEASCPLVLTAHPGALAPRDDDAVVAAPGSVRVFRPSGDDCGFAPLSLTREADTGTRLEEATVIVAAGRGIGARENLSLVEDTAALFSDSAVAASRPLCDLKWLPFSRQVGVTGRIVTPRLYLACGISGSPQHLAGMKGAQCVAAINTDPLAAIFAVADYIIIDDCRDFLTALVAEGRRRNG